MAPRQIKMPAKNDTEKKPTEELLQQKRADSGRYLLQVDRQTKGSYQTEDEAHKAGLAIKKHHPVVQVSVYDRVESVNTILGAPAPSSR